MSSDHQVPVDVFLSQCTGEMVPISHAFSYFSALPLSESDLKRWLYDPLAAVPPKIGELIPRLRFLLVPYLEAEDDGAEKNGRKTGGSVNRQPAGLVSFRRPAAARRVGSYFLEHEGETCLFLAVKNQEIADYHYVFYNGLAALVCRYMAPKTRRHFDQLVREELLSETHGEVDESSWRLKEEVIRRRVNPERNSKAVRGYLLQAFEDTLTLYFHGLCCDIDIEAGPRQLANRYMRLRLLVLRQMLPPPKGFALFPEDI